MRPGQATTAPPVVAARRPTPGRLLATPWWTVPVVAVTVLCLVATPQQAVRFVAGLAIAVGVAQQIGLAARGWRLDHGPAATRTASTLALAVALGALLWFDDHRQLGSAVGVGAGLVVAAIVAHQLARTGQVLLRTAHLPGAPSAPPPQLGTRWLVVELCAALSVVLTIGVLNGPPVIAVGVAVLLAVGTLVAARRYPAALRHRRRVAAALQEWRPTFVLPYNGTAGFHVGMWTPYLAPHRVVMITTRVTSYDRLVKDYDLPVLCAPSETAAAIAAMIPPTVGTAFYVHNGRTRPFLRHRGIRHVLLQHGDSDKQTSVNPAALHYDTVVVAGQAALDRFKTHGLDFTADRLVILGRPQTDGIQTVRRAIGDVERPTVLYAPTWKGKTEAANYSSLLLGPTIVAALLRRDVTVIFRPHPAGRHFAPHVDAIAAIKQLLRTDAEQTGRRHRVGPAAEKVSVAEVANAADAMISDVSGIVTDFMQSLKPFAMVSTKLPADVFAEQFPSSAAGYVVEPDLSNLETVLDQLLGSDPLSAVRAERRTYYLGGYDEGGSAVAFRHYVAGLADG